MTVLEAIQKSTEFLSKKGIESPRLNVELMLAHLLGTSRLQLYLQFEETLKAELVDRLRELIKRRGHHEPLQHLLGTAHFCDLELEIGPGVLIPRSETESLAEMAWTELQRRVQAGRTDLTLLDWGTGSGCLAIAIARHCPEAHIDAIDVSRRALEMAQRNAARYEVDNRIRFLESNGFAGLPDESRYDLIVANPPYIPSNVLDSLQQEVRDYDPHLALDGGSKGMAYHQKIAQEAASYLRPDGLLMLEFGYDQAEAIGPVFEAEGWAIEAFTQDFAGYRRFLTARPSNRAE